MVIDFTALSVRDAYTWMAGTIIPRPIAWVSTISPEGRTNLAPFSFFQAVTANPPTLMFVPVNDRSGGKKDTVRNIEQVTRRLMVSARADAGWLAAIQDGSLTVSVALKLAGIGKVRSPQEPTWRGASASSSSSLPTRPWPWAPSSFRSST